MIIYQTMIHISHVLVHGLGTTTPTPCYFWQVRTIPIAFKTKTRLLDLRDIKVCVCFSPSSAFWAGTPNYHQNRSHHLRQGELWPGTLEYHKVFHPSPLQFERGYSRVGHFQHPRTLRRKVYHQMDCTYRPMIVWVL